jgi:D-glycero-alpha-D-manno-heptose-7-phosphate kinase
LHIAVTPGVEVRAQADTAGAAWVTLDVGDERPYSFDPSDPPGRWPLLEATVAAVGVPADVAFDLKVSSGVPAGSSTGTSAAVTVALIAALDLLAGRSRTPAEVSTLAHRIETERVGHESGVQDQVAAAYGGINYVEIPAYPETRVTQLPVPDALRDELDRRLVLVWLGRPHVSSEVHSRVIAGLGSGTAAGVVELSDLRRAAAHGRAAIERGDLGALGRAMVENTEAQRRLHPDLVSTEAQHVIDLAVAQGASGWKVNGAGGSGGSITLLCGDDQRAARRSLVDAIVDSDESFEVIPIHVSTVGVRVGWDVPS